MQLIRDSAPKGVALRITAEAGFRLNSRSRNADRVATCPYHDVILAILLTSKFSANLSGTSTREMVLF
jgi:hypothetical protein